MPGCLKQQKNNRQKSTTPAGAKEMASDAKTGTGNIVELKKSNSSSNTIKVMTKKIAIPTEDGGLCSHFGHCQKFFVAITDGTKITNTLFLDPPAHEPGVFPAWLAGEGVTDVIAGGMGQRAIDLFRQQNINVYVGAQQKAPEELAGDLLNNRLVSGANYCDH